jgi:hypothetical protein
MVEAGRLAATGRYLAADHPPFTWAKGNSGICAMQKYWLQCNRNCLFEI